MKNFDSVYFSKHLHMIVIPQVTFLNFEGKKICTNYDKFLHILSFYKTTTP